jgi:hypothetical protein
VPDAAAVTAFVASLPPPALGLPAGPDHAAALAAVDAAGRAHIAAHGTFSVSSRAAAFVCS